MRSALLAIRGGGRWLGFVVVHVRCRSRSFSFALVFVRARCRPRPLSFALVVVRARCCSRPLSFAFVVVRVRCRPSFVFPQSGEVGGASRHPQVNGRWGWCRVSGVGWYKVDEGTYYIYQL